MQMLTKFKNIAFGLFKSLFAFVLLWWLYQKGFLDFRQLKQLLSPVLMVVAMAALILNFYFATWRWQLLLEVQQLALSRWQCLKLNLVGLFFNYVMPGGVGGDVVKAYYIVKEHPTNRMGAGMSVLLDRVMGLYAMLLLAIGSLLVNFKSVEQSPQLLLITKSCIGIFVLFTLGLILAFSEKFRRWGWQEWLSQFGVGKKLVGAYEAVYSYSHNLGLLLQTILLSVIAQSFAILLMWWLGTHLGFDDIPLSIYFSVAPLGFIVTAVPISPAGVGVGQMAFFFLFNLFLGHESQVGPAVMTAYQILNFILGLSGVWFFIQRKSTLKELDTVVGS